MEIGREEGAKGPPITPNRSSTQQTNPNGASPKTLIADAQGDLAGLLEMEDQIGNRGAGRGISSLPNIGGALEVA